VSPNRPLAVAALLLVVPLSGCAAGLHDATSAERSSPYNASADVGSIKVRAVTLTIAGQTTVATPTPTSAPSQPPIVGAPSIPPGTQAYLSVVFVNDGTRADVLTGAQVADGTVVPTNASTSPTVEPNELLTFTDPETSGASGSGVGLAVTGLSKPLQVGAIVQVTFAFQNAGQVSLPVPVSAAPSS
jgi:hypothetical protein